jgi:hypothetical protein
VVKTYDPRPWLCNLCLPVLRLAHPELSGLTLPEPGEWESEPDEIQWTDAETGYQCWMKRSVMGSWNGYVCVPRGHPWHGLDYDTELAGSTTPEELTDVHGGLTFAGGWLDEGDWWFGFDCAHSTDVTPALPVFLLLGDLAVYRHAAYVQDQCRLLALQLAEVSP